MNGWHPAVGMRPPSSGTPQGKHSQAKTLMRIPPDKGLDREKGRTVAVVKVRALS